MTNNIREFIKTCETLWSDFPATKANAIGQMTIRTAPYYIQQGFDISFQFNQPLSEQSIFKINQISHWLNQNFVIRLCAVLEYYGIISNSKKIDFELEGAGHVNILRRLRNCFVHSSGKYNSEDKDHRKTLELIRNKLKISIDEPTNGVWPIMIDKVLRPLHSGCITYSLHIMSGK